MIMMFPLLASAVTLYATSLQVGPPLFLVLYVLLRTVHSYPRVLVPNRFSTYIATFSMLNVALKLLTVNVSGSFPSVDLLPMQSVCRLILS